MNIFTITLAVTAAILLLMIAYYYFKGKWYEKGRQDERLWQETLRELERQADFTTYRINHDGWRKMEDTK